MFMNETLPSRMLDPNLHLQEPTAFSMTDTVVNRGNEGHPTAASTFSGRTIIANGPDPSTGYDPRQRVRKHSLDPRLTPPTIPPEHTHRTLILCFDGTGDQFDADNSNIVQLVSLLKKDDRSKQMVYYQAGIGTYTSPEVASPLTSKVSKTLDEMFAWNLDAHVMSGYEFLMQNYISGDRICIFGFSRGAYTARSLAGMIHKVGLLPADNYQQVPFAYKMYTRADHVGWEQSTAFKKSFSIDVDIEFLGVWDTVASVGIFPKRLPFTTSNTIVRTFRHAISLDERRAKFKANFWNRPSSEEQKLGTHGTSEPPVSSSPIPMPETDEKDSMSIRRSSSSRKRHAKDERRLSSFEKMYAERGEHPTDVEEVWFSGCHCDVGGGSVTNRTRHSLARISLRWMVRECFKTDTGIMFNTQGLREIGLDPSTLFPFVTPRPPPLPVGSAAVQKIRKPSIKERILARLRRDSLSELASSSDSDEDPNIGTEEEEDLRDAMTPIYDQLCLNRIWWVLELLPLDLKYQRGDGEWVSKLGFNFARPRFIPKQHSNGVKVHRTVKQRMDARCPASRHKKYIPKAQFSVDPTWID